MCAHRGLHALKIFIQCLSCSSPISSESAGPSMSPPQSCFWGMQPSISTTSGQPSYLFVSLLFFMCCWNTITVSSFLQTWVDCFSCNNMLQCTHFTNTHASNGCTEIIVMMLDEQPLGLGIVAGLQITAERTKHCSCFLKGHLSAHKSNLHSTKF